MLNLNRLRLLREVSMRGSLAAAASALEIDPSSVSHQLKVLGTEVGAPLLEPVGRGVRLTEAAQILVAHTETILGELESAEAEVARAQSTVSGTLRIASFQTAMHTIVPNALIRLRAEHPELEIVTAHISAEEALPALLARDFDLVLVETYPSRPGAVTAGVDVEAIGVDQLRLLTPGREMGSLIQQTDAVWVMEAADKPAGAWARAECRRAGFEPRIGFTTCDVALQVRLVERRGLACALVPDLALLAADRAKETASTITVSDLAGAPARRISTVVRRGSARTPSLVALRRALRTELKAHLSATISTLKPSEFSTHPA